METTNQLYTNINDEEGQDRISGLGKATEEKDQDEFEQFKQFQEWKRSQKQFAITFLDCCFQNFCL